MRRLLLRPRLYARQARGHCLVVLSQPLLFTVLTMHACNLRNAPFAPRCGFTHINAD